MFLKTSNAPSSSSAASVSRDTANGTSDPLLITVSIYILMFIHHEGDKYRKYKQNTVGHAVVLSVDIISVFFFVL